MLAWAESEGSVSHWRRLDDAEYDKQLRIKLLEEADEVRVAKNREELMSEIGKKKRNERGGFVERKFVDKIEHPEGSFLANYCLAEPNKYPEIK